MFEEAAASMKDGRVDKDYPNIRFPVSIEEVVEAEARLGRRFPNELREFFVQVGCGFVTAPSSDPDDVRRNAINRFASPSEVADLILCEGVPVGPSSGFREDEWPFFDLGESLYLVIRDGKVCWPSEDAISESLQEFVFRLFVDPEFFN